MKYNSIIFIIFIWFLSSASGLPSGEYEELLVDLKANKEESNVLSRVIKFEDYTILVPIGDLRKLRLSEEFLAKNQINFDNLTYVNLLSLENMSYKLNEQNLLLEIFFPPEAMEFQSLNARVKLTDDDANDYPVSGLYLNYNINYSQANEIGSLASTYEFNYFTPNNGVFKNSYFISKNFFGEDESRIVRLDSNWTFENPDDIAQWRVGDSVTKNAHWSSSTRFAGVQYATNFEVSPDLITRPIIDFSSSVTLPSAIDVLVNSRSIFKGDVSSGEFKIEDLPVPNGNNDIVIETKDITGQVTTITVPYYISSSLLREGLEDFSYSIGAQRQKFGNESANYRNLVTNIDYMYGVNNSWTSGFHFEGLNHKNGFQSTLGVTNRLQLYRYGTVSLSVANNLYNHVDKAQKFVIDYNYYSSRFSFVSSATFFGKKYNNALIEPDSANASNPVFRSSVIFSDPASGNLSINYLTTTSSGNKIERLSANYSKALTKNSSLRLSMGQSLVDKKDYFITLSYAIRFGKYNLGTNISKRQNTYSRRFNVAKSSSADSEWNYSMALDNNDVRDSDETNTRYDIRMRKKYEKFNVSLSAVGADDNYSQQASIAGSIIFMDNNVFFSRPIYSSIALAKVGSHEGIGVYRNGQLMARTNKDGKALIPNIVPYSYSKVRIDTEELPLSSHFLSSVSTVAPLKNTGIVIDFGVEDRTSVIAQLVDTNGEDLDLGYGVTAEGSEHKEYVGYYGQIYLRKIQKSEVFKGEACFDGECCNFEKDIENFDDNKILDLGVVVCK